MAETTVTIEKVFTKSGTSAKGPWTRYDVKAAGRDRRFQTFDHALGKQAQSNEGAEVTITYHGEKNGDFENDAIDKIEVVSESPVAGNGKQRSKEEMRWTEANHIAAILISSDPEAGPEKLSALAEAVYADLEAGPPVLAEGATRF